MCAIAVLLALTVLHTAQAAQYTAPSYAVTINAGTAAHWPLFIAHENILLESSESLHAFSAVSTLGGLVSFNTSTGTLTISANADADMWAFFIGEGLGHRATITAVVTSGSATQHISATVNITIDTTKTLVFANPQMLTVSISVPLPALSHVADLEAEVCLGVEYCLFTFIYSNYF
jgi:hypothetical protein